MRLWLISDHPVIPQTTAEKAYDLSALRRWAVALVQQGHQVYWLLSTRSLQALHAEVALAPVAVDTLPVTCRYVVPVQPYQLAGIHIFCVDQHVWQHADLHTRLFTFLCLFQRALACDVLHAWGALAVAYLAVYTARFLAVPAMVSYDWQIRSAKSQQPFLWDWVARQVAAAVVPSVAERERLLTLSPLMSAQVHVIEPTQPEVGRTLTALYARLCGIAMS